MSALEELFGNDTWITFSRFPLYMVSLQGEVISLVNRTPKKLRPIKRGKYLGFTLLNLNGDPEPAYLHRLVAEAAHGAPAPGQVCRHLDGNPRHNRSENLAWGTYVENLEDARLHGTIARGEKSGRSVLRESQVLEMRELRAAGMSYRKIAKKFNVSDMTAYRAVTGQSWSHLK